MLKKSSTHKILCLSDFVVFVLGENQKKFAQILETNEDLTGKDEKS